MFEVLIAVLFIIGGLLIYIGNNLFESKLIELLPNNKEAQNSLRNAAVVLGIGGVLFGAVVGGVSLGYIAYVISRYQ